MNTEKRKQRIKFSIVIIIIAIIISFAIFTVMRYQVEGEKNMPFQLGKIIVISSATTTSEDIENNNTANTENNISTNTQNIVNADNQNADVSENTNETTQTNEQSELEENYIWKENVVQTNDVYIYLGKNLNYKDEEIIKNVRIENIQILKNVGTGKIHVYMPNSLEDSLYKYTNEFLVNSTLTYKGATTDNKKTLEIGNQGGCICISFANTGLGVYKSNDDTQIEQGAYILEKMNIANEDLKFKVCFDLIIEVENKSYKANITLDLPVEELVGKKETHMEITNFDNIIFKRF